MFCNKCGAALPEGSKFCTQCGTAINLPEMPDTSEVKETETFHVPTDFDVAADVETNLQVEDAAETEPQIVTEVNDEPQVQVAAEVINQPQVQVAAEVINQPQIQNIPEMVAQPTEQPAKSSKGKAFLRGLLSVLCCIMIFVFSLTTLAVFIVRGAINTDRVENLVDEIDVETVFDTAIAPNINSEDVELIIDGNQINEIFNIPSINTFVRQTVTSYTDYLLGGDTPEGVDEEDIYKLVDDEIDKIAEIVEMSPEEIGLDELYTYLEENGTQEFGVLSADVGTNDTLDAIRFCISPLVIGFLIAFLVLFMYFLLCARKFKLNFMAWLSAPLMLTAVVLGIFASVRPIVLSILSSANPLVLELAELVMKNSLGVVLTDCGILLLTGILLLVIYIIIVKIKKHIAQKAA